MSYTLPELKEATWRTIKAIAMSGQDYTRLLQEEAEAEKTYNEQLGIRILELQSEGKPATTLEAVAKSDKFIVALKFRWSVAKAVIKAADRTYDINRHVLSGYERLISMENTELNIQKHQA